MKIRKLSQSFLLKENKQQALTILSEKGLDPNNDNFKEIKRIVGSNTSYLGLFTSFFFEQSASLNDLDKLISFLRSDDSKKLNKNPLSYRFEELSDEIVEILSDKKVLDFYKELPKEQQSFLDIEDDKFRNLADQFYDIKNKKGFYRNISKIKDFETLLLEIEDYIEKYKGFSNYDSVIQVLTETPELYEVVFDDKENEIIIAKIKKYEGSKLIGSNNWCIVNQASMWSRYTSDVPRNQYFVWNFGLELSDPKYFTAYTVDMNNMITSAFDFNNVDIKTKMPKHVISNIDYLKGPDKSDLDEIQLRKYEEDEAKEREERERHQRMLRERRERAEQHREEELFESDPKAIAIKEFLIENGDIEIDEESGQDIYDVLFKDTYTHYRLDVYTDGSSEWAVGDYDESHDSAYDSIESLIDDIGYDGFRMNIEYYVDSEKIAEDIASNDEDYWRDEWKDYGISAGLTRKGIDEVTDIIKFLFKIDTNEDIKSEIESINKNEDNDEYISNLRKMLDSMDQEEIIEYVSNLESILSNLEGNIISDDEDLLDELEEQRSDLYDKSQYIQDENDDDYWEMSESGFDSFLSDKKSEIEDDPIGYLKDMGYDGKQLSKYLEDYIDKDKFIEEIIETDGFGHILASYDGVENNHRVDGVDYYIFRTN